MLHKRACHLDTLPEGGSQGNPRGTEVSKPEQVKRMSGKLSLAGLAGLIALSMTGSAVANPVPVPADTPAAPTQMAA